jgi:hypothetical protein
MAIKSFVTLAPSETIRIVALRLHLHDTECKHKLATQKSVLETFN